MVSIMITVLSMSVKQNNVILVQGEVIVLVSYCNQYRVKTKSLCLKTSVDNVNDCDDARQHRALYSD